MWLRCPLVGAGDRVLIWVGLGGGGVLRGARAGRACLAVAVRRGDPAVMSVLVRGAPRRVIVAGARGDASRNCVERFRGDVLGCRR